MRVITGTARGRRLKELEGTETRPTTDRVKEGLFSALQFDIEGRRVLDLFAGSGQMGLEALSRGAGEAVFVDSSKASIEVVQKNIASTGLSRGAQVHHMDSLLFLQRKQNPFDIAFLDPPYRTGLLQQALPLTAALMNNGGLMIAEHPQDEEVPEAVGDFVRGREYRYGKILLTVYHHKDVEV